MSAVLKEAHESADRPEHETICCLPLMASDARVIELEPRFRISPEDLKLLECFASFAAVSVEKEQSKEIADIGKIETRLKESIADAERGVGPIPEKLRISPDEGSTLLAITRPLRKSQQEPTATMTLSLTSNTP